MAIDLRTLKIASPCTEKWADMSGDERTRHCQKCALNVFNFEGMSTAEIEALLTARQGRVCVRMYRRRDGTVLTRDCPVGVRKARAKIVAGLAMAFGLLLAVFVSLRRPHAQPQRTSAFWTEAKLSAERVEERARQVPVLGALIEYVDPAPVAIMGDVL